MSEKLPSWIARHLKSGAKQRIEETIERAEQETMGEIVPVIARSTLNIPLIKVVVFLFIFCLCLITHLLLLVSPSSLFIDLSGWEPLADIFIYALLSYILMSLVVCFGSLLFKLIPKRLAERMIFDRAELEFHRAKVHRTQNGTGVLIYISLYEHRVLVLADKPIYDRCESETWQRLVDPLILSIKKKEMEQGVIEAISTLGELLKEIVPVTSIEDNPNELKNSLVIIDH